MYQRYLLPKLRNQCEIEETPSSKKINSVTAKKAFGLHLNIAGFYKGLLSRKSRQVRVAADARLMQISAML